MITPIGRADARRAFVRRTAVSSSLIVTLTAIAGVIGLAVFADHADLVFRAAFAIGGALVALTVLNAFASYLYGGRDQTAVRRASNGVADSAPTELLEIEGRVSMARVSAFDYQSRLRPLLREIARHRLESNRNLDIEKQAGEARLVLGDELWERLQPMALLRDLRDQPGPTTAAIIRMVEKIESI